ncbi:MAG: DUF4411 family protein [Planctomycetota bacterium]
MTTYLLDANIFIQAKNLHYGMDFCPAFWDWLVEQNEREKVFSIEKVEDELIAGSDKLSEWAKELSGKFFLRPDGRVVNGLMRISEWVYKQDYEPVAVNTFLQVADYYLIAHALSHQYAVVTHERPDNGKRKIKIPNVCIPMNIKCMSPYEMLRVERARFVLGA